MAVMSVLEIIGTFRYQQVHKYHSNIDIMTKFFHIIWLFSSNVFDRMYFYSSFFYDILSPTIYIFFYHDIVQQIVFGHFLTK